MQVFLLKQFETINLTYGVCMFARNQNCFYFEILSVIT